jgi:hypothetical protein
MPSIFSPLTTAQLQALVKGFPTALGSVGLPVAGKTYTAAEAVTVFKNVLDARAAVTAAKAAWTTAVEAYQTTLSTDGKLAVELRDSAALMFSTAPNTLSTLEISPRKKPRPLSAEAHIAATAKAKATREARGTKSKKQKEAITGDVTGVTVTPVTTGAASTPSTATSPSAAPATTVPASSRARLRRTRKRRGAGV